MYYLFITYKSGLFRSFVQSNTAVSLTSCHVLLVGANEEHDSIKYDCFLAWWHPLRGCLAVEEQQ